MPSPLGEAEDIGTEITLGPGASLSEADAAALKKELAALLSAKETRYKHNRLKTISWKGYIKHQQVFASLKSVIAVFGANRSAKTWSGAFMTAVHATGEYPKWWKGKQFDHSVNILCIGRTAQQARDVIQAELLGDLSIGIGTGFIPKDRIIGMRRTSGQPDLVDTIFVSNVWGGISTIQIRTAEQGREKIQGTKKDWCWLDEEPKGNGYDIFSEARTRLMGTGGQILVTYTPLMGMNELSRYLLDEANSDFIEMVNITWDDAPHLTEKEKREMDSQYLPHEREARTKGVPVVRAGLVFPFPESLLYVDPFPIPDHWPHVGGWDTGYTTGNSGILLAQDPKTKIWYAVSEYHEEARDRDVHAHKIEEAWGVGIYLACDPSANRTEGDGKKTMKVYRDLGLNIHNANNDVMEGISSLFEAFQGGTLKIFKTLKGLRDEIRFYQFDDDPSGKFKVKKTKDHRIDSLRYAWMSKVQARPMVYFRNTHKSLKSGAVYGLSSASRHEPVSAAGY